MHILGTCSICKGHVTVPKVWFGTVPPTPECSRCGAQPAEPHGPTIKMTPRQTTGPAWPALPRLIPWNSGATGGES